MGKADAKTSFTFSNVLICLSDTAMSENDLSITVTFWSLLMVIYMITFHNFFQFNVFFNIPQNVLTLIHSIASISIICSCVIVEEQISVLGLKWLRSMILNY
jgi:hypothetical protein